MIYDLAIMQMSYIMGKMRSNAINEEFAKGFNEKLNFAKDSKKQKLDDKNVVL